MITDNSSAASDSQGLTLPRPVKYALVTSQNCLPHFVYWAMTTSTASVQAAAIDQALPITATNPPARDPSRARVRRVSDRPPELPSCLGMAMTANVTPQGACPRSASVVDVPRGDDLGNRAGKGGAGVVWHVAVGEKRKGGVRFRQSHHDGLEAGRAAAVS